MNNTEELLKPRIKVINDFWDNPFEVGQIIQFEDYSDYHDFYTNEVKGQDWTTGFIEVKRFNRVHTKGSSIVWNLRGFKPYPHLFKELEWWEEMEERDMPEYIKPIRAQQYVFKVYTVVGDSINFENRNGGFSIEKLSVFLPATKEEYENQSEGKFNNNV